MESLSSYKRMMIGTIALAAGYYLVQVVARSISSSQPNPLWLPAGLAFAVLMVAGTRYWPGVAIAAVAFGLLPAPWGLGWSLLPATLAAVLAIAEPALSVWVLRRLDFGADLETLRDVGLFGAVAVISAPLAGAVAGAALLMSFGGSSSADSWGVVAGCALGHAMGVLILSPALLALATHGVPELNVRQVAEAAVGTLALIVLARVIFGPGELPVTGQWPYVLFPPMVWAALRFRQHGVVIATVFVGLIATVGTLGGTGPFAGPTADLDIPRLQLFVGVLVGTGLALGAVVAERRTAEERLRGYQAELERAVDERTAELRAANAQLLVATQAKDEFLTSMSHELRTPLNSIIGFSEVLLKGMAGEVNAEQRKQLGMVHSSGLHLLDLIGDILDLSRIEAGEMPFEFTDFDLLSEIEPLMEGLALQASERGLAMSTQLPDGPLTIQSDARKIRQIVLNLVSNAIKYTEAGAVDVYVQARDDRVSIVVVDTGVGIPADQLAAIFEPFTQVQRPGEVKPEGTGLGLTISYRLARMLGGSLSVVSELGEGSTFTLSLPRRMDGLP